MVKNLDRIKIGMIEPEVLMILFMSLIPVLGITSFAVGFKIFTLRHPDITVSVDYYTEQKRKEAMHIFAATFISIVIQITYLIYFIKF